jgi:hypothetical protein
LSQSVKKSHTDRKKKEEEGLLLQHGGVLPAKQT